MTKAKDNAIPVSEWIVAGIGALFLVIVLATLVFDVLADTDEPPAISATVTSVVAITDSSYLTKLEVVNTGDQSAAGVTLEGTLHDSSGAVIERNEVLVDFLPPDSQRKVGLIFQHDPRRLQVTVRALSFVEP